MSVNGAGSYINGSGNYDGLALASTTTFNFAPGSTLTVNVPLMNVGGGPAAALIMNGSGLMDLTGSSTFTGGTTVNGGTLELSAGNHVGRLGPGRRHHGHGQQRRHVVRKRRRTPWVIAPAALSPSA